MRLRKREIFVQLGYEPHPGQILVHRSTARYRVLACGARFGKSLSASMEACAALLEPKDRGLGWIVAPTRDLADRIFMRVVDALKTHFAHRVVELDLRVQKIVVHNLGGGTSELRGKSADMPVTLLGEALDFLIVDEAAKLRAEIWENYLSPRLLDRKGWVLFLSTPQGLDWFYQLYRRGQKGRDPGYESWASPSWDNPHLDRAVIEAERTRCNKEVFEQEYGAVFLGAENEPCETCGCPSESARGLIVWDKSEQPELPTCSECGNIVDEQGRSVVARGPDGKGRLKIIWHRGLDGADQGWNGMDPP